MTNPNYLTEFMGILLTKEIDTCLRLQSLLRGVSRAELIRDLVEEYLKSNQLSSESLLERYAEYIHTEWHFRFREKYTFKEFVRQHYVPAIKKQNHPDELVSLIIKKCEEVAKKASATKSKPTPRNR